MPQRRFERDRPVEVEDLIGRPPERILSAQLVQIREGLAVGERIAARGAAAVLVGIVRGVTIYFNPSWGEASMYLLMALVLLVRPRGLFGERIQKFE